jgi:uncharacterized protein (DUF2235 family)
VAKNIPIFADGTGNESGLLPDESRTNVYKLFRATRTGPDTTIDPNRQIAFYIPGVGTPGMTPPSLRKRVWKGILPAMGSSRKERFGYRGNYKRQPTNGGFSH